MKEKRLPNNSKEGVIYGSIICLISVTFMLSLNIIINVGRLDKNVLSIIIKSLPLMFVLIFLLENIAVRPVVDKLNNIFTSKTDSFNSKILFNILFTVTIISFIMTIIGPMLANGISLAPVINIFKHWPLNFFAAFWMELLIAQPVARLVMVKIHS